MDKIYSIDIEAFFGRIIERLNLSQDSVIYLYAASGFLILLFILIILLLIRKILLRPSRTKPEIPQNKEQGEYQEAKPVSRMEIVNGTKALLTQSAELIHSHQFSDAEKLLQEALEKGQKTGNIAVLSETRYHLGLLNREMGDLTLACEHWQIARELYSQNVDMDKVKEVENLMRENGCPTDWVLNDF